MKIKINGHSIYDKMDVKMERCIDDIILMYGEGWYSGKSPVMTPTQQKELSYSTQQRESSFNTSQSCGILLCKCERFPRGCPPSRWRINSYARPLTRFKCRPKNINVQSWRHTLVTVCVAITWTYIVMSSWARAASYSFSDTPYVISFSQKFAFSSRFSGTEAFLNL